MMYSSQGVGPCGDGCGSPPGGLNYVGSGQGSHILEPTYRYVGYGGDFAPPRRDFTCLITTCCLLSLLLLIPLLLWLLASPTNECNVDQANWQYHWSKDKQLRCCASVGIGCPLSQPQAPQAAPGPVDPFNCALGDENWKAGWSQQKKQWCCEVHKKGCPEPGESWAAVPADQYDCNAGFENFVKGWSTLKKNWCCQYQGKGCVGSGAMNAAQASSQGFGAGAEYGNRGAPVALPFLGTR